MLKRCRKQLISGITAFLTLLVLVAIPLQNAPTALAATIPTTSTITIYPAQQYQKIQGWGTSLAWWANIIGGWSNSQRTALADALYSPTKGIGLNLARYNFGADGPTNVCHNEIATKEGRNVPSFEPTPGNYVWNNDVNQLWFAEAAKARGADVFEGFVNSAPAWMLINSCTAGGVNGTENLSPAHYNDFVNYIATIAKHFHTHFGITLQTVAPLNESGGTWWNSIKPQEGMFVSIPTQNTIITLLGHALKKNDANDYTSISAPDDENVWWSVNDYNSYSAEAKSFITQWNTHTYGSSPAIENTAYTTIGQTNHKRLWMSEWGTGSKATPIAAALALSQEVLTDEQNLHPASWVAWQAVNEPGGTATSVWGLAYRDANNNISYPSRYYAMGNYSKYVREGSQMIGNSDANTFTAYDARTKTLTIVATNSSTTSEPISYDLSKFRHVGRSATPHQTTATENLQRLRNVRIFNKALSTSLPAESITTFVIPDVA